MHLQAYDQNKNENYSASCVINNDIALAKDKIFKKNLSYWRYTSDSGIYAGNVAVLPGCRVFTEEPAVQSVTLGGVWRRAQYISR